jgi:diketogulonate reductase-like aldo/keto reductase
MQQVVFGDSGRHWPALGLGTWRMGESGRTRRAEVAAVRLAIEIGYRVFDTAEMYGEGGAEEVLGEAIAGALRAGEVTRDALYVVSKVYPHHASRDGVVAACERSRRRLGLDRIDLYLLHWRGAHPLADTLAGFAALRRANRIGAWGVSNFDVDDMDELVALPGGDACATNQVYYALGARGVEFDLLPWQRERGMPLMAYCPIDQARHAEDPVLAAIAARHGVRALQVALAWVLAQPGVVAIPKSVREAHLRDNFAAAGLRLDAEDRRAIDARFPPPTRKTPLAMT